MPELPEPEVGESNLLTGKQLEKALTTATIKEVTLTDTLRNKFLNVKGKLYGITITLKGNLPKPVLPLNKTNYKTLKQAFGANSDRWIGKKVNVIRVPRTNVQTGEPTQGILVEVA